MPNLDPELLTFSKELTLLYVEDDTQTQMMMLLILKEYFDHIITANDGQDGLEKCISHQIDLVITDITMPNLDGLSMIARIKKQQENLPILLFTAYDHSHFLHDAIQLGVDGYLLKPLDLPQFEQTLFKTVRHMKIRQENLEYKYLLEQKIEEQLTQLKKKELILKEQTKLAYYDQLTSIHNRYGLQKWFNYTLSNMTQADLSFALIVMDVDDFKYINDHYGHATGDNVLKEIGQILNDQIRKIDIAARWGGEEFVILLSDTSVHAAYDIAERIRSAVQAYNFTPLKKVTASFGVVAYKKGETLEAFINRGDHALYKAKHAGKNQVVYTT